MMADGCSCSASTQAFAAHCAMKATWVGQEPCSQVFATIQFLSAFECSHNDDLRKRLRLADHDDSCLVLKSLLTDSDRKHENFEAIENKLQEVNLVVQKQLKAIKELQAAVKELTERNAGQVKL